LATPCALNTVTAPGEHGAAGGEIAHHVTVVDDLVVDVDRRAVAIESAFHDLDRPGHARTEPAGLCEQDVHQSGFVVGAAPGDAESGARPPGGLGASAAGAAASAAGATRADTSSG
jgi:hypothetical protein